MKPKITINDLKQFFCDKDFLNLSFLDVFAFVSTFYLIIRIGYAYFIFAYFFFASLVMFFFSLIVLMIALIRNSWRWFCEYKKI